MKAVRVSGVIFDIRQCENHVVVYLAISMYSMERLLQTHTYGSAPFMMHYGR